jgi:hypothetical protein
MDDILDGDGMERVREQIVLMQQALAEYEDLSTKIVKARWSFEMLTRRPEIGIQRDPKNPRMVLQQLTPRDLALNIARLADEREAAGDVLKALTGAPSVDGAREAFFIVLNAFQRANALREARQALDIGSPDAIEGANKALATDTPDVDVLRDRLNTAQSAARGQLAAYVNALPPIVLTQVDVAPPAPASSLILE